MGLYISGEDFLNSFNPDQVDISRKYLSAKELYKEIKNKSKISRILKIPNRTMQEWLNGDKTPIPVKQLEKLEKIGLMPLQISENETSLLFVDIFSFLFGDGHLTKGLERCILCGEIEDLRNIQFKLLQFYGIDSKIKFNTQTGYITKINGKNLVKRKVVGKCNSLSLNCSALARLFYIAGAPRGDKVNQTFILPHWLFESTNLIKKHFLGVIFGNELSLPKLRAKNAFGTILFGMHKSEQHIESLINFLDQIRLLLSEFNIKTSVPKFEGLSCLRKDNIKSGKCYFLFNLSSENILNFYYSIPLLYSSSKMKKFSVMVNKVIKGASVYSRDWDIYDKAMELRAGGLGHVKIFNQLGLSKNYLYKLNSWIYYGNKPRFYNIRTFVQIKN